VLAFHIDHLHKVIERAEGRLIGDVVDEEEGIGAEVGCGPETAVFFLAGGIGQGKKVMLAIDGSGDGIRVLWLNQRRSHQPNQSPVIPSGDASVPMVGSYLCGRGSASRFRRRWNDLLLCPLTAHQAQRD
jgi:hypothetical protein